MMPTKLDVRKPAPQPVKRSLQRISTSGSAYSRGKRSAVITTDALWILLAAARSMRFVPGLTQYECQALVQAIAAGHRALSDIAPRDGDVL